MRVFIVTFLLAVLFLTLNAAPVHCRTGGEIQNALSYDEDDKEVTPCMEENSCVVRCSELIKGCSPKATAWMAKFDTIDSEHQTGFGKALFESCIYRKFSTRFFRPSKANPRDMKSKRITVKDNLIAALKKAPLLNKSHAEKIIYYTRRKYAKMILGFEKLKEPSLTYLASFTRLLSSMPFLYHDKGFPERLKDKRHFYHIVNNLVDGHVEDLDKFFTEEYIISGLAQLIHELQDLKKQIPSEIMHQTEVLQRDLVKGFIKEFYRRDMQPLKACSCASLLKSQYGSVEIKEKFRQELIIQCKPECKKYEK